MSRALGKRKLLREGFYYTNGVVCGLRPVSSQPSRKMTRQRKLTQVAAGGEYSFPPASGQVRLLKRFEESRETGVAGNRDQLMLRVMPHGRRESTCIIFWRGVDQTRSLFFSFLRYLLRCQKVVAFSDCSRSKPETVVAKLTNCLVQL